MHNELTQSDIKKMEEEIEYRKVVVRKEKLEAVKEARAQGDLSENFEYYAAKKDKNANEKRIRYLDRMVRTAEIIKDESADDEVGLNNTVRVYFEEDEEEGTITIYGDPKSYAAIQKHLEECGFEDVGGEFTYIPNDMKDVTPEQRETIDKMIERLEEFDDVQTVYTNMKPEEGGE